MYMLSENNLQEFTLTCSKLSLFECFKGLLSWFWRNNSLQNLGTLIQSSFQNDFVLPLKNYSFFEYRYKNS